LLLVVIAVLLAAVAAVVVALGSLPGAIAHQRGHSQAAVLLLGGIVIAWFLCGRIPAAWSRRST
jgi:hypothetical protein